MRVTLLGLLAWVGVAILLVYIGNELRRTTEAKAVRPPLDPGASINP
jgi:hypothetical protein